MPITLILWRKGVIEIETKDYMIARDIGKIINNKRLHILGNS